jgi:hypothetical protein
MISGEVDEAWAKQHHDIWLEEMIEAKQLQEKTQGSALKAIDRLRGDITQQSNS